MSYRSLKWNTKSGPHETQKDAHRLSISEPDVETYGHLPQIRRTIMTPITLRASDLVPLQCH